MPQPCGVGGDSQDVPIACWQSRIVSPAPGSMARFAKKASWQRHRAAQRYREIAERTWKVPLPGPEKSLLRYRGKASAELAPSRSTARPPRATRGAEAEAHQHDPEGGAGAQGRHSLQGVPRILRDRPPRRNSTTATAPGSISGRCATPATSRPRRPRPSWSSALTAFPGTLS